VISHVTHATSESELKETLTIFRFYGPNMFEDAIWAYIAPPSNFMIFQDYLCIIIFSLENYQNATKFIKYPTVDRKLQLVTRTSKHYIRT
jgi:hypothetical protein